MNALCLDQDSNFKSCPFRVFQEEHKAITVGAGDVIAQEFYPCIGEKCIAYHVGVCLRLASALEIDFIER